MSETYGSLLRKIRKEAGYTGVAFSKLIGVSPQTLSSIELDERAPFDPFVTCEFVAELGLDCYLEELLTLQANARGYIEFDKCQGDLQWDSLVKLRNKILLGKMSPEEWEVINGLVSEGCHV